MKNLKRPGKIIIELNSYSLGECLNKLLILAIKNSNAKTFRELAEFCNVDINGLYAYINKFGLKKMKELQSIHKNAALYREIKRLKSSTNGRIIIRKLKKGIDINDIMD